MTTKQGSNVFRFHAEVFWNEDGKYGDGVVSSPGDFRVHYNGGISLSGSSGIRSAGYEKYYPGPEDLFVSSVSSSMMLSYIDLSRRNSFNVLRYLDEAEGYLTRGENGRLQFEEILLNPRITIEGPYSDDIKMIAVRLIHEARYDCFISNSILSRVEISPLFIFEH